MLSVSVGYCCFIWGQGFFCVCVLVVLVLFFAWDFFVGFFCGLVWFCFAGVTILIICMKFLFSPSALSVCGTDSSREVNECYCISEEELFHAITLKVHERTE